MTYQVAFLGGVSNDSLSTGSEANMVDVKAEMANEARSNRSISGSSLFLRDAEYRSKTHGKTNWMEKRQVHVPLEFA